jgi:hypothetical protein
MKVYEVHAALQPLQKLSQEALPIKVAYRLTKLIKMVEKEVKMIEEFRVQLLERYCIRNEDGSPVIEEGHYAVQDIGEFQAALNDLGESEAEIDFQPLKLEDLGDIKIAPSDLFALEKFIVEG